MKVYNEEDFLQLSGIQHFKFCRRQWALIHIEQQWAENVRTVDGELMHERAHDPTASESRGDLQIMRGVRVHSAQLGISGECDVVEFRKCKTGVSIAGRDGFWSVRPIEYKRGEPKDGDCDSLQLCAQAMCLEEMLCCKIMTGSLYYGKTHHRQEVEFTEELRHGVRSAVEEMHRIYEHRTTPKVKPAKHCNACSLKELCMPILCKEKSVFSYLKNAMDGKL